MKKYKIGIELFGQCIYITVEAVSSPAAQALAIDKLQRCKKLAKEVIEL